jgi:uncharacterized caspase-like protein
MSATPPVGDRKVRFIVFRTVLACLAALAVGLVGTDRDGQPTLGGTVAEAQGSRSVLRSSSRAVRDAIRNQIRQALRVRLQVEAPPRASVERVRWAADGTMAVAVLSDGTADAWFLDQGVALSQISLGAPPLKQVELSRAGAYVAAIDRADQIAVANLVTPEVPFQPRGLNGRATVLTPKGAEPAVLIGTDAGAVYEISSLNGLVSEVWRTDAGPVRRLDVDASGSRAVVQIGDRSVVTLALRTGATAAEGDRADVGGLADIRYTGSGPVALTDDGSLLALRGGAPRPISSPMAGDRLLVAEDGVFALLDDAGRGAVWSAAGVADTRTFAVDMTGFAGAELAPGGALLLVRRQNGWVDGHDIATEGGRRVFRLVVTRSGWAAIDEAGRYDGSLDALREVGWGDSDTFIAIDRFSSLYFEPGLVRRYMERRRDFLTAPPKQIQDDTEIAAPAEIEVSVDASPDRAGDDFETTATLSSPEPLQDIRVYHNGRVVPDEDVEIETETRDDGVTVTVETDVEATEGENTLQIVGESESGLVTASEVVAVSAAQAYQPVEPTLVVKSFGINQYASNDLALNFAASDAEAIADRFSRSEVFEPSRRKRDVFLDRDAGRSTIVDELQGMDTLNSHDMAVIFLAGHGVASPRMTDWYFLPHEARSLSDMSHVADVGISEDFLIATLTDISADRVLLLIDSCQSGVVAEEFSRYVQRRSLKTVADKTGIQILTATRPDQLAPEVGALGHGLFTFVVLGALERGESGRYRADIDPIDGVVSVEELKRYVEAWVPIVSRAVEARMTGGGEISQVAARPRGVAGLSKLMPVASTYGRNFRIF